MERAKKSITWDTWLRNCKRIERALLAAGVKNRTQLMERYDKHRGVEGIKGIGPALRRQLQKMLDEYGSIEWNAALPLIPWGPK